MTGRLLSGVFPIVATPFRADRAPDVADPRRASWTSSSMRVRTAWCFRGSRASSKRSRPEERRLLVRSRGGRGTGGRHSAGHRRFGAESGGRGVRHAAQARDGRRRRGHGRCAAIDARRRRCADRLLPAHRSRTAWPSSCRTRLRPRAAASRRSGSRKSSPRCRASRTSRKRRCPAASESPGCAICCRVWPASSVARADGTSPTSLRAAPVARCRRAS